MLGLKYADAEAETPILWSTDANSWLIGKDPDAGKDWRQKKRAIEKNRGTEDEMVGWHHRFNGLELGQTLGDSEGQGDLACCSPWASKEPDMVTEQQHICQKNFFFNLVVWRWQRGLVKSQIYKCNISWQANKLRTVKVRLLRPMFRLAVCITAIPLSVVWGGEGGDGLAGGHPAPWARLGSRILLCGFEHPEILGTREQRAEEAMRVQ